MIDESQVQAAFDWLQANETDAAEARAERVYLDEFRKSLKAVLMRESNGKTIGDRESFAYSHERYLEHLTKIRDAVVADETYRARISRSKMLLEFWRSQESSRRAVGGVG